MTGVDNEQDHRIRDPAQPDISGAPRAVPPNIHIPGGIGAPAHDALGQRIATP
jgi:hypothetical protein